jgi:hypothetical protein
MIFIQLLLAMERARISPGENNKAAPFLLSPL